MTFVILGNVIALLCLAALRWYIKNELSSHPSLFISVVNLFTFFVVPIALCVFNIVLFVINHRSNYALFATFVWMLVSALIYALTAIRGKAKRRLYERFEGSVMPLVQAVLKEYRDLDDQASVLLSVNRVKSGVSVTVVIKVPRKPQALDDVKERLSQVLKITDPNAQFRVAFQYPIIKKKGDVPAKRLSFFT